MAQVIEQNLGLETLIETIRIGPDDFFKTYHDSLWIAIQFSKTKIHQKTNDEGTLSTHYSDLIKFIHITRI